MLCTIFYSLVELYQKTELVRAYFPSSKLYISLDQLTPLSAVTISGVIKIDIDQFMPLIFGRRKESFHWYPVWFGQLRLKFAEICSEIWEKYSEQAFLQHHLATPWYDVFSE